jgi:pyrroline-5-carboxylate reductase
MNARIAFIGAGNMSRSLIGGLIAGGYDKTRIFASDPNQDACQAVGQGFGIECHADNAQVISHADLVVLAVKPQQLKAVCQQMADQIQSRKPLIVSIAAGVRSRDIESWLGGDLAIVRAMPNTPSLIQTGASGLFANNKVNNEQRNQAEEVLRAAGLALWVSEEDKLDAVTALSGSGPAYYFLFMEAMEAAGQKLGLDQKTAHLLTLQTAFGAAKMALESSDDCATLRRKVTSPNGTTEKAIQSFEADQLDQIIERAMQAAKTRAQQLADELGD